MLVHARQPAVENERDRRQQGARGRDGPAEPQSADGERRQDRPDADGGEDPDVHDAEDAAEHAVVGQTLHEGEARDVELGVPDPGDDERRDGHAQSGPDADRDERRSPQRQAEQERPAQAPPPDERRRDERAQHHTGPEHRAEEADAGLAEAERRQRQSDDVDVEHPADERLRPESTDDRRDIGKADELPHPACESHGDRLAVAAGGPGRVGVGAQPGDQQGAGERDGCGGRERHGGVPDREENPGERGAEQRREPLERRLRDVRRDELLRRAREHGGEGELSRPTRRRRDADQGD